MMQEQVFLPCRGTTKNDDNRYPTTTKKITIQLEYKEEVVTFAKAPYLERHASPLHLARHCL